MVERLDAFNGTEEIEWEDRSFQREVLLGERAK